MKKDKRMKKILFYLSENLGILTSLELASKLNVSERTIKSDLARIRNEAINYGFQLFSKAGLGYWIEIIDIELFEKLQEEVNSKFSTMGYTKEYEEYANEIVKYLLVQDEFVTIEEIANYLYLSVTSINKELFKVRAILTEFNLRLESKRKIGTKVIGLEINKRFCMLELRIDHDIRLENKNKDDTLFSLFKNEIGEGLKVRDKIIDTLNVNQIRMTDNNTHRLVSYLVLLSNRASKSHFLQFNDELITDLKSLNEFKCANNIVDTLNKDFNFPKCNENELIGVTLLILLFLDFDNDVDMYKVYPFIKKDLSTLENFVINYFLVNWKINILDLNLPEFLLRSVLFSVSIRKKYNEISYDRVIGKKIENNQFSSSSVSISMSLSLSVSLLEELGVRMNEYEILKLAILIYSGVRKIEYEYKPKRILITAQNGIQSSRIIEEKLNDRYKKNYSFSTTCLNSYEIKNEDLGNFDIVISNFDPFYFHFNIPFIYVDAIPNQMQLNRIFEEIIIDGFQIHSLIENLQLNSNFIFDDFDYQSKEQFLQLCAYKYCNDNSKVGNFNSELNQYTDLVVWNEIAVIVMNSKHISNNIIDLYSFEKSGIWGNKKIRGIVFCNIDFDKNIKKVKLIEQLTSGLVIDKMNFENMVKRRSKNNFDYLIKKQLSSE